MRAPVLGVADSTDPSPLLQRIEKQNHRRFLDERQLSEPPLAHGAAVRQGAKDGEMAGMKPASFYCPDHMLAEPPLRDMHQESYAGQRWRIPTWALQPARRWDLSWHFSLIIDDLEPYGYGEPSLGARQ